MRKKLQPPFEITINRDQDNANIIYYLRDIAITLRLFLEVVDYGNHSIDEEEKE